MLDFLDMFNWVDRVTGFLLGIKHGGARQLRFDREVTLGEDGEQALSDRGVRVFGRRVNSADNMLSVPDSQARWAEYNLLRMGASLKGRPVDPKNAEWAARHGGQLPPAWKDKGRK